MTVRQLDTRGASRVDLQVPGGTLAALQAGRPGDPAVLLVPGYTGSKEDFGPILATIASAGFHVTAVDQRGQFESPGWPDETAYTLDALAADLLAVAASLGERVHLLGHSFGGLVARTAALGDPGRFVSLTLMDSGPAGIGGGRRQRLELLRPALTQYGLEAVYQAARALEQQDPGFVPLPPALEEFLHRRFVANHPAGLLGMGTQLLEAPDRTDELAAAALPMLVLAGADDDAWPVLVQAGMADRLGAKWEIIDGAAHSPAVENPAPTAETLIEFWRYV